jgi:hypothetical protein
MAVNNKAPYGYALGLNTPLAILYNVTSRRGLGLATDIVLVLGILAIFAYVALSRSERTIKILKLCVVLGSLLFWATVLLVYGHLSESYFVAYDISDTVMYTGLTMVFVSLIISYIVAKKSIHTGRR